MNTQRKTYKFAKIALFVVVVLLLFGPLLYRFVLSSTLPKTNVSNNDLLKNISNSNVMNCLVPPCPQMN